MLQNVNIIFARDRNILLMGHKHNIININPVPQSQSMPEFMHNSAIYAQVCSIFSGIFIWHADFYRDFSKHPIHHTKVLTHALINSSDFNPMHNYISRLRRLNPHKLNVNTVQFQNRIPCKNCPLNL